MSEETQRRIDAEVKRIIDECYARARKILEENRDILDAMAQALMKYETIGAEQLDQLMARKEVTPPDGWVEAQERADQAEREMEERKRREREKAESDRQQGGDDVDQGADPDSRREDDR
jgi:cell division protease FtsH